MYICVYQLSILYIYICIPRFLGAWELGVQHYVCCSGSARASKRWATVVASASSGKLPAAFAKQQNERQFMCADMMYLRLSLQMMTGYLGPYRCSSNHRLPVVAYVMLQLRGLPCRPEARDNLNFQGDADTLARALCFKLWLNLRGLCCNSLCRSELELSSAMEAKDSLIIKGAILILPLFQHPIKPS